MNRAHRSTALSYVRDHPVGPLPHIVSMRLHLSPLLHYRNSEFKMNSLEEDTKRQASAAKDPEMTMDKFFSKDQKWPLLTAALGILDKECMAAASSMVPVGLSDAPAEWQTLEYNNELFILSTRVMCGTEMKLARVHRTRLPASGLSLYHFL